MTLRKWMAVALMLSLLSGLATAQPYENLKILPKDIKKDELTKIMKSFTAQLGVRCNFCHLGEADAPLSSYDFVSDENKHKRITRVMMRMTDAINKEYLEEENVVTCDSCHRGTAHPRTLPQEMSVAYRRGGVDRVQSHYKRLRDKYYGLGAYNFGERSLLTFGEKLAAQKKYDDAIAVLNLNLTHFPKSAMTHAYLGEAYKRKGDKANALKFMEKALSLDPANEEIKKRLQGLKQ